MKIKLSESTNKQLDWLVAKCENTQVEYVNMAYFGKVLVCTKSMDLGSGNSYYDPSANWELAGPIIEREWISVWQVGKNYWKADISGLHSCDGNTARIAAMRCYVLSKLGSEVEVPDDLK